MTLAGVWLAVTPGRHTVQVELADTADATQFTQHWTETVAFQENNLRVVLFDTKAGFSLH